MTDETTRLPELGVDVPLESYDIGYDSPDKSYAELLVEAFQATDTHFGEWKHLPFRPLSDFDTLQAAVDWSEGSGNNTVVVDKKFTTDETGVTVSGTTSFIGHRPSPKFSNIFGTPAIVSTATTSDPFIVYSGNNINMRWHGLFFFNDGAAKPAFRPVDGFSGFINTATSWRDVMFEGFGAVDTDPYTVHLHSAYGTTFEDVHIGNADAPTAYGAFRFQNCNACDFSSVAAGGNFAEDAETPVVYIDNCRGSHFDTLHVEGYTSDAAVQISNGLVALTSFYTEAQSNGYANVGLQIGDGGLTAGHTNGATADAKVTLTEPLMHAFNKSGLHPTPEHIHAMRILNAEHVNLIGGPRRDRVDSDSIEYGGSEHDTADGRTLTVSPGALSIMGNLHADIINSTGSVASVSIQNGRVFDSVSAAETGLIPFETGRIDTGGATGWAYKDESGDIHTAGIERVIGPTASAHAASHGETVIADTSAGNVTVTLPAATRGAEIVAMNGNDSGGGDLVIDTADSATINGGASLTVSNANFGRRLVCDGTNWFGMRA